MDFFLIFSIYGFRSSQSTADLLTVVPDKIARAFNRWLLAGATQVTALDRVWHAGLLLIFLSIIKFSGQIFGLIPSFLSNR